MRVVNYEQLRLSSHNAKQHLESCKEICLSNLKHLIDTIEKGTGGEICCIPNPSAYRSPTKVKKPHCIFYVGLMKMDEDMQLVKIESIGIRWNGNIFL